MACVENKIPGYACPVCGNKEYKRVVVPRDDGRDYQTMFFACVGCTAMFLDPYRFTNFESAVSSRRVKDYVAPAKKNRFKQG